MECPRQIHGYSLRTKTQDSFLPSRRIFFLEVDQQIHISKVEVVRALWGWSPRESMGVRGFRSSFLNTVPMQIGHRGTHRCPFCRTYVRIDEHCEQQMLSHTVSQGEWGRPDSARLTRSSLFAAGHRILNLLKVGHDNCEETIEFRNEEIRIDLHCEGVEWQASESPDQGIQPYSALSVAL